MLCFHPVVGDAVRDWCGCAKGTISRAYCGGGVGVDGSSDDVGVVGV
jgi:hypothetical protein